MANISSYPQIGALATDDLLTIVDISNSNSTKTVELGDVVDFISSTWSPSSLVVKKVTITADQLYSYFANPIELVPAQGVGKYISIVSVDMKQETGGKYSPSFFMLYNGTYSGRELLSFDYNQLTYNQTQLGYMVSKNGGQQLAVPNDSIVLTALSENITQGSGDVTFWITYQVIDAS